MAMLYPLPLSPPTELDAAAGVEDGTDDCGCCCCCRLVVMLLAPCKPPPPPNEDDEEANDVTLAIFMAILAAKSLKFCVLCVIGKDDNKVETVAHVISDDDD